MIETPEEQITAPSGVFEIIYDKFTTFPQSGQGEYVPEKKHPEKFAVTIQQAAKSAMKLGVQSPGSTGQVRWPGHEFYRLAYSNLIPFLLNIRSISRFSFR